MSISVQDDDRRLEHVVMSAHSVEPLETPNANSALLLDYDQLLDRDEVAELVYAEHQFTAGYRGFAAQSNDALIYAEVATSSVLSDALVPDDLTAPVGEAVASSDDTIDVIGAPFFSTVLQRHIDANGGSGAVNDRMQDEITGDQLTTDQALFDPRDELDFNVTSRFPDSGLFCGFTGQHIYRVYED